MVTPGAKRDAAMHAQTVFGLSERRACDLVGVSRRVARYRSTRPDDTPLRVRLRELAAERRRLAAENADLRAELIAARRLIDTLQARLELERD